MRKALSILDIHFIQEARDDSITLDIFPFHHQQAERSPGNRNLI